MKAFAHAAAAGLIMRGFESRTAAHIAHLQTKSYAAHKALGEYYDGIIDLVDSFAEGYQGIYGIIAQYPDYDEIEREKDMVKMLTNLRDWITAHRAEAGRGQTELENDIDSITSLINSTLYKLKHLS